jgi:hypothetical protein
MRRRRGLLLGLAALVALGLVIPAGCSKGPRVRAGNLKEKREKKRALMEAQRQAREAERQRELAAESGTESPPPEAEAESVEEPPAPSGGKPEPAPAPEAPDAAPAESTPGVVRGAPENRVLPPRPEPGYYEDSCRVTLRRPDGSEFTTLLYQPLFGYMERTYRTNGGVVDDEHATPMFRFQVGLSLHKVKFRNIDKVEVLEDPESRTQVRFRFTFRKGRKPVDFPAEQLVGAGHPRIPFLQGMGAGGLQRYPLFQAGDDADYMPIVEIDFTP